ncbi:MAG: hypothetical protein HQL78_04300 [Magnetococcales bacterium]|nr:hypothetical protein [Magnetococcales bacterium]
MKNTTASTQTGTMANRFDGAVAMNGSAQDLIRAQTELCTAPENSKEAPCLQLLLMIAPIHNTLTSQPARTIAGNWK